MSEQGGAFGDQRLRMQLRPLLGVVVSVEAVLWSWVPTPSRTSSDNSSPLWWCLSRVVEGLKAYAAGWVGTETRDGVEKWEGVANHTDER